MYQEWGHGLHVHWMAPQGTDHTPPLQIALYRKWIATDATTILKAYVCDLQQNSGTYILDYLLSVLVVFFVGTIIVGQSIKL